MRIRVSETVICLCLTALALSGCGQKGPLFMPEDIVTNQSAEPQLTPGSGAAEKADSQTAVPLSAAPANTNAIVQPSSDNER